MKIAIKLLFLLTMTRTFTLLAMGPEDSTVQEISLDVCQLLQKNVQLNTQLLQIFRANLEERLKSLQELQKGCSVSELGITAFSPEIARNVPDNDIGAYLTAVQETKTVLEQIAECALKAKNTMLADHRATIRKIEQAKGNATLEQKNGNWSGPRDC